MKKFFFLFLMVFLVLIAGPTIATAEPPPGIEAALFSANATAPIALDKANFMNVTIEIQTAAEKNDSAPAPAHIDIGQPVYADNNSSAPLIHRLAMKRTLPASPADLFAATL